MCTARTREGSFSLCVFFSSLCYSSEYIYLTVNIESEGFYHPERLLPEAIKVMRTKISTIRNAARALLDHGGATEDVEMSER